MVEAGANFSGKVVFISGAGREPGRALSAAFARWGAVIAANDLNPLGLEETMRNITDVGGQGRAYLFDVAKRMPVLALVDQILEDWGRIDILVNCASVKPSQPISEVDEWDWHRTIDVNLSGTFFTIQQVSRLMRRQGGGVILNLAGWYGDEPLPRRNHAAYLSSQLGLLGLTLSAAEEFAGDNIRVNLVCLGLAGMLAERVEPVLHKELQKKDAKGNERLARIVRYLCNPNASGPTGQVVNLEGEQVV